MRAHGRATALVVLATVCGVTPLLAHADSNQLTWAKPTIAFDGGPLVGDHADGHCLPTSCAPISVTVGDDVAGGWAQNPGGIVATIQWQDPNVEIDLFGYDAGLHLLDSATFGGVRSQRIFIANPAAGTYQIWAQAFSGQATTFTGSVSLQHNPALHASSATSTMRFSPPALVDPQITTGEPATRIGPRGESYIDAPWQPSTTTSFLWQSQPAEGNLTYKPLQAHIAAGVNDPRQRSCSETVGGGDADVAALPNGHLLFADLYLANISVSRSTDNGASWTCKTVAASTFDVDRPWLLAAPSADGDGPKIDAYLVYRSSNLSGQFGSGTTGNAPKIQVDASSDDGLTWLPVDSIGDSPGSPQQVDGVPVLVKDPGPMFAGQAHDASDEAAYIYEPFAAPNGRIYVSHAPAGSNAWATTVVASRAGDADYGFVTGAADAAGTAYIAWIDQGTFAVDYSKSTDDGATWSTPVQVSAPGTVNVMPWLAAGRAGDVAIGWYGASGSARPDLLAATTQWRPMVARSVDAASTQPTFETAALTSSPVHVGPLCVPDLPGGVCGSKQFGDFFTIGIAPNGQLRAAFDADAGAAVPFIETTEQIAGTGLYSAATAATEARGDAATPGTEALDLTALPATSADSVSLQVADGAGIGSAADAYLGGAGSQATWLLTWLGPDGHVRYAGLRIDKTNGSVFFGGTSVANTTVGQNSNYVRYPDATPAGATPVTGAVSAATGMITLTLPAWLRGDGNLRSLQAWTMIGVPQASEPFPLTVVDSTAPYDTALS